MKAEGKVWVFYDSVSKTETKPLTLTQAQMMLLQFKVKDLTNIFLWTPGWEKWKNLKNFIESDQTFFVTTHPPKPEIKSAPKKSATSLKQTEKLEAPQPQSTSKTPFDRAFTQIDVNNKGYQAVDHGYWAHDFNGDMLDYSAIQNLKPIDHNEETNTQTNTTDDRRQSTRHNFKLEVVLINKKGSFRTYSKNISLTGTLLEQDVPADFIKNPFELVIINRFEKDPKKGRLLFKGKVVGDLANPRRLTFVSVEPDMIDRLEVLLKAYIQYQELMKKSG